MISVQYPHFGAHPFGGMMSEPNLHSSMPPMPKSNSQSPFGLSAEQKSKPSTGLKKRPSRAGTRSVSTLTVAQLERKRANDREAQRAIRQRTKDHIEGLERQIRELTASSDANAKLMSAMQRNTELEQENTLLRSRLNHAVATMSDHGLNSDHIMLSTSPSSPTRRIKLAAQIRTSTTPVPRSIPTPVTSVGHHEQWGSAYSPASSTIERSPSIADVSPVTANMRWGQQPPQLSPALHEPERPLHSANPTMQQPPMAYGYQMESNVRPVQPVQPVQPVTYTSEPQMMPAYTQPAGTPVSEYPPRHHSQPMQPSHTPTYAQYPANHGYMPHSPHESEPHMQMMHRQPMDQQPQLMYNMPQNMKPEP